MAIRSAGLHQRKYAFPQLESAARIGGMRVNQRVLMFDAADMASESRFWAGVLDGTVKVYDRFHMVFVEDKPLLGIQLAPDHIPPDWPDGAQQQIHLDLWVDDFEAAHDEVMSLGARLLKPEEEVTPKSVDNFRVYADPAGHPFCICWYLKR
jgi:predicted enzyme related to lactoylglutathione lyase